MTKIFTIGFSGKKQDSFLEVLDAVGVKTLIDIRLWRVARFVPWASGINLTKILGERYKYYPELAPTKELLGAYKDGQIDWAGYKKVFNGILTERQAENLFQQPDLNKVCFLCSEKSFEHCHRRLVAEYLARHFPDIQIVHL